MNFPEPMLAPQLARRIEELRCCDNVDEVHIVGLYDRGTRALVLLVPKAGSQDVYTEADWQQPDEPVLMVVDSATLCCDSPLH